jgi:hypothetical protein
MITKYSEVFLGDKMCKNDAVTQYFTDSLCLHHQG